MNTPRPISPPLASASIHATEYSWGSEKPGSDPKPGMYAEGSDPGFSDPGSPDNAKKCARFSILIVSTSNVADCTGRSWISAQVMRPVKPRPPRVARKRAAFSPGEQARR